MRRIILTLLLLGAAFPGQAQDLKPLYTLFKDQAFGPLLGKTTVLCEQHPENPELNQLHGRALVEVGRAREAIPFLEAALRLDKERGWITAWSLGYLGTARFMTDDPEGATKAFADCLALNATANASAYARKWLFATGRSEVFARWHRIETAHFRFALEPPFDEKEAASFAELREQAFARIMSELGLQELPKKIDFLVWANRRDPLMNYNLVLGRADPDRLIVYCARDNTIGHEMTHVITPQVHPSRNPVRTGLINEGAAVYFDQSGRDQKELTRDWLYRRNQMKVSLVDVWTNWKKYPDELSYPLAGAFVGELIRTHGMDKFRSLLSDQSLENARFLYGPGLDDFIRSFEASLSSARP